MGKANESIYRWWWGWLVANKQSIYYIKWPFWQQNFILKTTRSPEQFETFMKKLLNLDKTSAKSNKKFCICFKNGKKGLSNSGHKNWCLEHLRVLSSHLNEVMGTKPAAAFLFMKASIEPQGKTEGFNYNNFTLYFFSSSTFQVRQNRYFCRKSRNGKSINNVAQ